MAVLKPEEFGQQFTEAARRAQGQVVEEGHLLVLKCVEHDLQLQQIGEESVMGCPHWDCKLKVGVEVVGE